MNNSLVEDKIKELLVSYRTIAIVGVSSEKKGEDKNNLKRKPANVVMKYMQDFGYKVYPINPFAIGETINGETVVGRLDDIEEEIDILDVFRPSKEAPNIAKEAIKKKVKVFWLQYGIHSDDAEKIINEANIKFVSNRCIKQDYQKIFLKSNPVFPVLKN